MLLHYVLLTLPLTYIYSAVTNDDVFPCHDDRHRTEGNTERGKRDGERKNDLQSFVWGKTFLTNVSKQSNHCVACYAYAYSNTRQ